MFKSAHRTLIDWLIVLIGVSIALWFVLTSPVFPKLELVEFEDVDPKRLSNYVKTLSEDYTPRMPEFENLRPSARYIKSQFDQFTKSEYQDYEAKIGRVNNVVAKFGPDTAEVIVVGAHYDAYNGMPGADGNASGVAALFELARILAKHEKLPIRIELVAYALGVAPYYGSSDMGSLYHAEKLRSKGNKVRLMMVLDGLGYFSEKTLVQRYPYSFMSLFYPRKADFIMLTGRIQDMSMLRRAKKGFLKVDGLKVKSLAAPELLEGIAVSDETSYWRQGYNAIRVSDTGHYRHPGFHTEKDTANKLDYETMSKVVQGVGQVILDAME